MINQALNYLSTAIFNYILCVKVSEVCFDRNMYDLLHTSTSCHFKICLKSHTVTLLEQRLDESLLWRFLAPSTPFQKMEPGIVIQQPNVLGRSLRIRWPSHQPFFRFKTSATLPTTTSALSRSGKMKSRQLRMTCSVLIITHALINIVEEFHRQGVRRVMFGSLVFPRHHGGYNKRCSRLNKLPRKHARCEYYKPFWQYESNLV